MWTKGLSDNKIAWVNKEEKWLRKQDALFFSSIEATAEVSDETYDERKKLFAKRVPTHPYLQEVGAEVIGKKVDLPIVMGGFDQLRPSEVDAWIKKISKKFPNTSFYNLPKLDGISILLHYHKGELKQAYTRGRKKPGDAKSKGKPVLQHALALQGVPKSIRGWESPGKERMPRDVYIRGEAICHTSIFEAKLKGRVFVGSPPKGYAHPRAFVAGMFNRDVLTAEQEKLLRLATFVAFSVISKQELSKGFQFSNIRIWNMTCIVNPSRTNKAYMKVMKESQLKTSRRLLHNPADNIIIPFDMKTVTEDYLISVLRNNQAKLDLYQDGLVIEVDAVEARKAMGGDNLGFPKYAVKVKPEREQQIIKVGEVSKITWQFTSRRLYIPVAHLKEPLDFNGLRVTRMTAHSAGNLRDMKIGIGDKIRVCRAGDVIPYLMGRA